ncbi:fluoride efflux transporter CrcB [Paenibacillus aurantius]|uniref:Fluoride-specific ion channel FluC n=1 Tax=Paenibacillus aurantius TaxID=2918900 RepID=A0AA96RGE9_9BACL|nr:fluoride efflux transporter CrcB [Paenibacillus aurantius]WNQ12461.1 fluoride efflux transporter CrcB [Paenibacillus aurantius]
MIYFIIGGAGAAGALLRYAIGLLLPWEPDRFPAATLTANVIGCFLLAGLLTYLLDHPSVHPYWKSGLGTGFIGSFTTFSTFSVETVRMAQTHHAGMAAVYVLVSIWAGLGAAGLGHVAAKRGRGDRVLS